MSNEQRKSQQRQRMIREQLAARGIRSPAVLRAFETIDRAAFVPQAYQGDAYADTPLPIGHGQTISQPYIVALSLQELAPQPGQRVLDIGSGSGYQTALLACLAGEVYAIERIEELASRAQATLEQLGISNVHFRTGDGSPGLPAEAPFDRIICAAASPTLPDAWAEQLAPGGRIVAPIGPRDIQSLIRADKLGDKITTREICGVRFVPLLGQAGW